MPHRKRLRSERAVLDRHSIGVGEPIPANYKTGKDMVVEMSCEEMWCELPNYIGGKLSVGLRAAIEEHFKNCKHCIAALGGTGNVLRLVGDAAAFELCTRLGNSLDREGKPRQEQARRTMNQRTVLYVDDNPKAQRMLTFALVWIGYKVVTACNGEALELMRQTSSDLVLVAYRMPQKIGSKLPREIKQINRDIPIILVSGHTLLPPEEMTYVNAYVGEGATLDELLTQMRALLAPT
jgi:CheY-like chemotaxis protein